MRVLVVDGANVVGSRPDGWWRDRPGAARRLHGQLEAAHLDHDEVFLILEGQARAGVPVGGEPRLRTVHAPHDGDAAVLDVVRAAATEAEVTVVTADRGLRSDVEAAGARVVGPSWLLDLLA